MQWLFEDCVFEKTAKFQVFHDESLPDKQWLLIGLLFVNSTQTEDVLKMLRYHRNIEGYEGEIHFCRLPKSFKGKYGGRSRVARRWMESFENGLSDKAFFSCLAVDRHSPAFERERFSRGFHEYNRFTAMALKAGIAWHLGPMELDKVKINFVSDAKDRASGMDKDMKDNFEEYIPKRAQVDSYIARFAGNKNYPEVSLELELRDSAADDLLQFTDILLGATQMALVAGAVRPTKRALGLKIVNWCQDLRKKPRERRFGLWRKFSVWGFPDANGRPFNNVPMRLEATTTQQSLFVRW